MSLKRKLDKIISENDLGSFSSLLVSDKELGFKRLSLSTPVIHYLIERDFDFGVRALLNGHKESSKNLLRVRDGLGKTVLEKTLSHGGFETITWVFRAMKNDSYYSEIDFLESLTTDNLISSLVLNNNHEARGFAFSSLKDKRVYKICKEFPLLNCFLSGDLDSFERYLNTCPNKLFPYNGIKIDLLDFLLANSKDRPFIEAIKRPKSQITSTKDFLI